MAWLSVTGGCVSVIGDWLIRIALFLLIPLSSTDFSQVFVFDPRREAVAFLSGFISVVSLVPSFVKRIRLTIGPNVVWTKYGVLFGALAGVFNIIILASIHLTLLMGMGVKSGALEGIMPALSFLTYIPLAVLILGLPAATIGVFAGVLTEIVLRRFVFPYREKGHSDFLSALI